MKSDIDYMEWAISVRAKADASGLDLHDAFGVVRMPRPAWRAFVSEVRLSAGPSAAVVAEKWYEDARARVCRLAGSLVAMDVRTRKVAV